MIQKPKRILDLIHDQIQLRHYSHRTEESYIHWIKEYIFYFNKKHPAEMGKNEINEFLSYLATERHVSASTQNQALGALLFLYRFVLNIKIELDNNIVRAKRSNHIPVVFTKEEAKLIISNLRGVYWLISNLLYGSGLRLLECLKIRVKDIDFNYNQIIVRDGKGEKDRITILPISIKEQLKEQIRSVALIHKQDLEKGFGTVELPYSIQKKYPNAEKELIWQWVFPASTRYFIKKKTLKEDTIYMKAQFREKLKKPFNKHKS